MGRQTTLLFYRSFIEEEFGENIPEMKFWSVNKDKNDYYELMPHGCKSAGDEPDFVNHQMAKSSKEYIKKFDGYYDNNFPFISETAIDELISYLRQFSNTSVKYVILDSLTGGELCYIIRATVSDNIIVTIEVMNFDASTVTKRIELTFEK